jgi:2-polyprenyl-3-methyl-5-hydroxy-6-metoxy-1,4-benzoquinol methylase
MSLLNEIKSKYKETNGVFYIDEAKNEFEDIYIKLREAEGRLYGEQLLKHLPDVPAEHKHYKEWQLRKKSANLLMDYLGLNKNNKTILDAGCGNGWLANKLAGLINSEVTAIDVNKKELELGAKMFTKDNIVFVHGDVFNLPVKFDYIILAGVVAYFKDLKKIILSLLDKLNPNGEIHIIDSPFYKNTKLARQKSAEYYTNLGFPEMINHYHHHTPDAVKEFNYRILYNPEALLNKIQRAFGLNVLPFFWIKITA